MPQTTLRFMYLLFLPLLASCGALAVEDVPATIAAENVAYVTQAAQMRATLEAQDQQVFATSIAAETEVAEQNRVNAALLATVQAGNPPTVQVVARAQGSSTMDEMLMEEGGDGEAASSQQVETPSGLYLETTTSAEIRNSDGCAANPTTQFSSGTTRVYAVLLAQNVPSGTRIGIDWDYAGSTAVTDAFEVANFEDEICFWFFLEPYSEGDWSVQFRSNGTPVGDRVSFSVGG